MNNKSLATNRLAMLSEGLLGKIAFTALALIIYRIGSHIPIPGIDTAKLSSLFKDSGGFLNMMDAYSGGAVRNMAIFTLNIAPYILASIFIQLSSSVFENIAALKKEGTIGRRILNNYTKRLAVVISILHASVICIGLEIKGISTGEWWFVPIGVATLVCGVSILMWLSDQITKYGLGQGSSILIFAGIVSGLPANISTAISSISSGDTRSILTFLGILLFMFLVATVVIIFERAELRLPMWHSRGDIRNMRNGGTGSYLPMKVNISGVVPTMFAGSVISTVSGLAQLLQNNQGIANSISDYLRQGSPTYVIVYVAILISSSFFYSFIVIDVNETADNLRKYGYFFPNIRPGSATIHYLKTIMNRLNTISIFYLCTVCVLPETISSILNIKLISSGSSIMIIVGVTVEIMNRIMSNFISQKYKNISNRTDGLFTNI